MFDEGVLIDHVQSIKLNERLVCEIDLLEHRLISSACTYKSVLILVCKPSQFFL